MHFLAVIRFERQQNGIEVYADVKNKKMQYGKSQKNPIFNEKPSLIAVFCSTFFHNPPFCSPPLVSEGWQRRKLNVFEIVRIAQIPLLFREIFAQALEISFGSRSLIQGNEGELCRGRTNERVIVSAERVRVVHYDIVERPRVHDLRV